MDHLDRLVSATDTEIRPGRLRPRPHLRYLPQGLAADATLPAPPPASRRGDLDAGADEAVTRSAPPAAGAAAGRARQAEPSFGPAAARMRAVTDGDTGDAVPIGSPDTPTPEPKAHHAARLVADRPNASRSHGPDQAGAHGALSPAEPAARPEQSPPPTPRVGEPGRKERAASAGPPRQRPADPSATKPGSTRPGVPADAAPAPASPPSGRPGRRGLLGLPWEPAPGSLGTRPPAHAEPPSPREDDGDPVAEAEPPVVNVSIGRVEVVGEQPTPSRPRPQPRLSLDEYLEGRR